MMRNKGEDIILRAESRQTLVRGFDKVADLVRTTLGPKGRNIVIERYIGYPLITKDGVTVAKHIHLPDSKENMGARLCREVAEKTNELVGDGTTTSIVLAQAMVKRGIRLIEAGIDPFQLKKGMEKAVKNVIQEINRVSIEADVEGIYKIASIASKNRHVGKIIAEGMAKVGLDGIIAIRATPERRSYVELTGGMELNKGYYSANFCTDEERMQVELENAFVLIADQTLDDPDEIKRVLNWCIWDKKPILIMASNINKDVLETLLSYKKEGKVKVAFVQAPGSSEDRLEILTDLAVFTGGTLVARVLGMSIKQLEKPMLGEAEKITITRDKTIVLSNKSLKPNIEEHLRQLKVLSTQTSDTKEQEKIKERIARMAGGVAIIWIGGDTEIAMKELKDRAEDAVQATRAAVESGIVPGGGTTFLHASKILDHVEAENEDELAGIRLVQQALSEPLRQIAENAGVNGDQVIEKCRGYSSEIGYDAMNKQFGNIVAAGIVDPAKVAVTTLKNAAGIASLLLTAEGLISKPEIELPEPIIW